MTTRKIDSITRGRGRIPECEICGNPAALECLEAPTVYCSPAHFESDWFGIRHLIASETMTIRAGLPVTSASVAEREAQLNYHMGVIRKVKEVASEEARRHLISRNFQHAIGAGLEALKMCQKLKADVSDIAECHLLLAEANLGLNKFPGAQEFLTLAAANINEKSGVRMVAQLQRNFGKLFSAQGKRAESLQSLAACVYYTSVEFGTDGIQTAPAYFHLGQAFGGEVGDRFIKKVLEIYMSRLFWEGQTLEGIAKDEAVEVVKKVKDLLNADKVHVADCEALLGLLTGRKELIELAILLYLDGGEATQGKLERIKSLSSS